MTTISTKFTAMCRMIKF